MDLILYNGIIHTMNGGEVVSAIAVENGLITLVGTDAEILALKTADTKMVDLKQRLAIPGFNDSHLHVLSYGVQKSILNLTGCTSVAEIVNRGREYIAGNPVIKLVYGRGWNQDYFSDHVMPTKSDLDGISREIPIVFSRVCGHSAVANTAALAYYGIDENTKPPEGGGIDFEKGHFSENALGLLGSSTLSTSEMKAFLEDAMSDMVKRGVTSAQSDDFGYAPYEDVIAVYNELANNGKMPLRVTQQCNISDIDGIRGFIAYANAHANALGERGDSGIDGGGCSSGGGNLSKCSSGSLRCNSNKQNDTSAFFRLGPIKLLADGSLGARTALMSQPYNDDATTSGIACYTQPELDEIVEFCHKNDWPVAVHCIGDKAWRMVAESVEKAQKAHAARPRHGIVHCQISDMPMLKKMKELDLLAYVQPIFLDYDLHIVEQRVGPELASTSYNFKTLYDLGVHVALGTDCPVERFDPLANIYCAVTRKDLNGFPDDGFYSNQALTVQEAVYCYTCGAAYCSYEERVKGRLEKGYYADITVIDRDIFSIAPMEIKDANVLMTITGGKIVYDQT